MRFDGMEAAAKTPAVPHTGLDQLPAGVFPPDGAKEKIAEAAEFPGSAGIAAPSIKYQPDAHAYERISAHEDEMSEKLAREAIERANRALIDSDRKFEITIHEKTRDVMVKVVNTRTNETIREIPPKKIVDLVVRLCEMAGILFDEKG
jgi:flagellar protein FlaG